jgi:EF hand
LLIYGLASLSFRFVVGIHLMWRFLAGVTSTLLLITAGFFIWQGQASTGADIPPPPGEAGSTAMTMADISGPPTATEKTREEKRFGRYDKDKNGAVSREEYLTSRRKAYSKMDVNGDGRLSFDEYAVKTITKFSGADRDRTGALTAAEFLTTRVVRNTVKQKCPPPNRVQMPAPVEADEGEG